MLRTLVLFLMITTPLLSQDLLVDAIDREFSGTLIEITDTDIIFQIQGETEPVQYPFWAVKRVTLANGRLAFEDGKTYVAKPTLPVKARPAEPAPTVPKPEEPLPIEAEPEAPAQPRFDPKTRELIPPEPAEPEPVITAEPDTGQEVSRPPAVGPKFFPLQFTVGLSPKGGGSNLGISYRFSKPKGIKVSRKLGEVMIYPVVTVGISSHFESTYDMHQSESVQYGLVEGHRQWESDKGRISLFLGAGLGRYHRYETRYRDEYYDEFRYRDAYYRDHDEGIGLVLSAGAQVMLWRLTGDLRLYRTPGLGKFLPMANVGYQPKSFKEALTVAACACVVGAGLLLVLLMMLT